MMTAKGLELLYNRLLTLKRVPVFSFNIDDFVKYCNNRGTNVYGGAYELDFDGKPIVQMFYID